MTITNINEIASFVNEHYIDNKQLQVVANNSINSAYYVATLDHNVLIYDLYSIRIDRTARIVVFYAMNNTHTNKYKYHSRKLTIQDILL